MIDEKDDDISRRAFIGSAGAALVVSASIADLGASPLVGPQTADTPRDPSASRTAIGVTVNGKTQQIEVGDHWTLAELLRDHLRLTGTKLGCERGECGACTVLLDGAPVYSCSYLAAWADGHEVDTVEGLIRGGALGPLQQAFVEHDAPQCGFCTSGQLMSATALLKSNPRPSATEIRAALAGNICRCANYNRLVEAVTAASVAMAGTRSQGGAQ
jgi:aerobic-type carbon monoxide dehydrogenase small subunit (CoxS/CutS family)